MFQRLKESIDQNLYRFGLRSTLEWEDIKDRSPLRLYAGEIFPGLQQFKTHVGLTPYRLSAYSIQHDVRQAMPIADQSVDSYQSEDVFEHIEFEALRDVFNEIYRVLKPGGLFRLSLPDYGCDVLKERCLKGDSGKILFDPEGGGRFVDGKIVEGGHLWFPTFENVQSLFEASNFSKYEFLHYTTREGESVLKPIDYDLGMVRRTPDFDSRVQAPRRALSIVVDAYRDS